MRLAWLVVILVTACGRIGFDPDPTDPVNDEDAPAANLMCAADRTTVGNLHATGELAITATADGFFAAWTGTASRPASIVKLDTQLRVVTRQILNVVDPHLVGVLDLGTDVLAAYAENGIVNMWKFTADLSITNYLATLAGLAARAPFAADRTGSQRAYVSAHQNILIVGYMDPNGYTGRSENFLVTGTITEVSGDSGIRDGVMVWVEQLGGTSRCTAANIRFDSPSSLSLAATRPVSSDCRSPRIVAGPSDDARLVVSTTAAGAVEARYSTAAGDVFRSLSRSGRAPKVRFDGTRFWIAWLDNLTDELRVATLDAKGNVVNAAQPGPRVAGDEAFDLVRSGSTVYLVTLTAEALDFITLCR